MYRNSVTTEAQPRRISLLIHVWLEPRDAASGAPVFRARMSDVATRQARYFDSPRALLDGLRDVLIQAGVMANVEARRLIG